METCLCGEMYVTDGLGEFCSHCLPTREGLKAVMIGVDEVWGQRRMLLFEGRHRSKIVLELKEASDAQWATIDVRIFEGILANENSRRHFEDRLLPLGLTDQTPVPA